MPTSHRKLLIAIGAVGLLGTTLLLLGTDVRALGSTLVEAGNPRTVSLLLGATLTHLGLRFLRFQYFLRRAELRRPERDSLRIFLGSLGFGFVPLLAGEIAFKAAALGRGDRRAARSGALVAISERLCDVAALSAIAALHPWLRAGDARSALEWGLWLPPILFLIPAVRRALLRVAHRVVSVAMRLFGLRVPFEIGQPPAALLSTTSSAIGLLVGVVAWGELCIAAALVAGSVAPSVEAWHVAPLFAKATLLGSASLSPGGIGVTGVLISRDLASAGVASPAALAVVILLRGTTFWLTLALGQLVLLLTSRAPANASESHFDALSPEYDAQVPAHIRDLLVERKTRRMLECLPEVRGARGLDIGCGLGWYMQALQKAGAQVTGIDLSAAQARAAARGGDRVVRASAVELPFAAGSFDFAYSVNVLHHLPSRDHQHRAFGEIARVLKPGGLFLLHEINVTNPLFRFYMGYVFPLIRQIDEGTERWIDPEAPPASAGLRRIGVQYFTFVPDFLPQRLLRSALPLEARLERSALARYSAHYMLTLERSDEPVR